MWRGDGCEANKPFERRPNAIRGDRIDAEIAGAVRARYIGLMNARRVCRIGAAVGTCDQVEGRHHEQRRKQARCHERSHGRSIFQGRLRSDRSSCEENRDASDQRRARRSVRTLAGRDQSTINYDHW